MVMANSERAVSRVLLISPDASTIEQICDSIAQFAMSTETCIELSPALRLLSSRKFDAVIVDYRLGQPQATSVLEQLRVSASNRTSVSFAISDGKEDSRAAFHAGFRFVLEKPLTRDSISRTLKAAYGLIVREQRRYFRYSISLPVAIEQKEMPTITGQTVNISEGGMAVTIPVQLSSGTEGTVRFSLPNQETEITADSRICWYSANGRAGLSFLSLSSEHSSELQEWLARRLEQQLPASMAEKFRKTDC